MRQVDTIVLVNDIKKTQEFYKDFFSLEVLHDWGNMVVFNNRLAFHQLDKIEPKEIMKDVLSQSLIKQNDFIIYIELENKNIYELFHELKEKNIDIIHDVVTLPWQKIFRIYDIDGHIIEIGSPITE